MLFPDSRFFFKKSKPILHPSHKVEGTSNLGDGKETLGQRDNIFHLFDRVDTILNGLGMLSTRLSQNILDLINV